ncbi:HAD family hydrolase [Alkalibacterium psychrotolerans]
MKNRVEDFKRQHDYLVCVDSDGCAIDTMDIKHFHCFGPRAVDVFGVKTIKEDFLTIWNDINLFSMTRGINRFKGLVLSFEVAHEKGFEVPLLHRVKQWTEETDELSNRSLQNEIDKTDDEELKLALEWSNKVNKCIEGLSGQDRPFDGVKEGLAEISKVADIAIVSSANSEAVLSEWTKHDLAPFVEVMLGQEAGSKAYCISQLKKYYESTDQIVMVGDAPGDLDAAEQNGVHYYPIVVGKETESWERLKTDAKERLLAGSFDQDYQTMLIEEFKSALS